MAGNLSVTFQDLKDAGMQATNTSNDIESTLAALRARIDPIHASWQGSAKQQFDLMWKDWETSSKQLLESLDGIGKLLSNAGANYEQAESQIAGGFRQ